jgi:hypothetical protein
MKRGALSAVLLLGLPLVLSEFWTFIAIEVLAEAAHVVKVSCKEFLEPRTVAFTIAPIVALYDLMVMHSTSRK